MAGDYIKFQRHYQKLTTDIDATAMTPSPTTILTVRNTNYQIYIQKAELIITTFFASILTLVGHTSGVVYARFDIPAAPTTAPNLPYPDPIDYGPTGTPVQLGESVDVVISAVGFVGILHIEAYQKQGATISSNAGALAQ